MRIKIFTNLFFVFVVTTLIESCSKKSENFDLDFSTLNKSNKIKLTSKNNKESKKIDNLENKFFIKDLMPLKDVDQVLSKTKFGKKDPYSEGERQLNRFNSDFKLKGFLNTKIDKYALVNYLNNEGTITESSIGGVNTNLLPNGAKVIRIDPKNNKLTINFENENFIFEL
ncbi:hypothetical protein OA867_01810 [Prochlorococcus sp. AH-716-D22]|nr:hypothetical protein [Prochlorococcus sp. AH-716-D22]